MAMSNVRLFRRQIVGLEPVGSVFQRAFSAKKKGGKGGASDGPKTSILSKEVKSSTVVGANTRKDGTDPKIVADSEYPDWLFTLLDKRPALSELRRKDKESLSYEELKRLVKLDTRARINKNNLEKAKN